MRNRYGIVLAAAVVALITTLALPSGRHTGAVMVLLEGGVLVTAILAAPPGTGGRSARVAAFITVLAVIVAAWLGSLPGWLVLTASAVFLVAAILTVGRGALSSLARDGVTVHVVAAALALYLLAGLLFATIIGAIASGTADPYFANGTDGSPGDRIYYSFAVLTTTGFGDFTPTMATGRAIAVLEMLIGQIYLVTVVAMLIGNLRRREPSADDA
jgi:Ion channel